MDMFFKKIATYDKIKFPQQANSMVGCTRRNCAYDKLFFANQTENDINFNLTSTKIAKSLFKKKWTYDKIELTARSIYKPKTKRRTLKELVFAELIFAILDTSAKIVPRNVFKMKHSQ